MRAAFARVPMLFFDRPCHRLNSLLVPDLECVPALLCMFFRTLRILKRNDQNAIVVCNDTPSKLAASF